jgi:hypothetical protein
MIILFNYTMNGEIIFNDFENHFHLSVDIMMSPFYDMVVGRK